MTRALLCNFLLSVTSVRQRSVWEPMCASSLVKNVNPCRQSWRGGDRVGSRERETRPLENWCVREGDIVYIHAVTPLSLQRRPRHVCLFQTSCESHIFIPVHQLAFSGVSQSPTQVARNCHLVPLSLSSSGVSTPMPLFTSYCRVPKHRFPGVPLFH